MLFIEKIFSSRWHKLLLFLVSYLIVVSLAAIMVSFDIGKSMPIQLTLMLAPIFFPYLLANWILYHGYLPSMMFPLIWCIYIFIALPSVAINNKPIAKTLYIIFVLLLLSNFFIVFLLL